VFIDIAVVLLFAVYYDCGRRVDQSETGVQHILNYRTSMTQPANFTLLSIKINIFNYSFTKATCYENIRNIIIKIISISNLIPNSFK
jgi:hypothetical protein